MKKKINPVVSEYYRQLQKKSRESFNRNLLNRAKKLKEEGKLKTSV